MKKYKFLTVIFFFTAFLLFGEDLGVVGVRQKGAANAGYSYYQGAESGLLNPALYSEAKKIDLFINGGFLNTGVENGSIKDVSFGVVYPLFSWLSFSSSYFGRYSSVDTEKLFSDNNVVIGTSVNMKNVVSFGFNLRMERWSSGAVASMMGDVSENLRGPLAVTGDIGLLFTPVENLRFSISGRSLIPSRLSESSIVIEEYTPSLAVGFSLAFSDVNNLVILSGAEWALSGIDISFAVEDWVLNDNLGLRGGIKSFNGGMGVEVDAGLTYRLRSINKFMPDIHYAFSYPLLGVGGTGTHIVGLSTSF